MVLQSHVGVIQFIKPKNRPTCSRDKSVKHIHLKGAGYNFSSSCSFAALYSGQPLIFNKQKRPDWFSFITNQQQ